MYMANKADFYTTRGVAPWWSGERMQLQHMEYRLLYNQRSRPLVVRRENAASTHGAQTSIQPSLFCIAQNHKLSSKGFTICTHMTHTYIYLYE